jgi:anti-sigma regulatory factor (Ser/Thr protein kinase)
MMLIKTAEELQRAQQRISEFLERNSLTNSPVLEVAINEAMNNGFCSSGQIILKLKRLGDRLIIRIKDGGQGFNTKEVNVQLKKDMKDMYEEKFKELLEAEAGRGILLMKLFCDKVIYNDKGNEVLLMKQINTDGNIY